jgi:fucose 4-O-acetylase-like acetyltransferase
MDKPARDPLLDYAKAVAILLVVAGHTIQASDADFDNNLAFRLIYSFHMPLFMFLSGMVTAFWLRKFLAAETWGAAIALMRLDLVNKVVRLLLPFWVWVVVKYVVGSREASLLDYAWMHISAPDYGLWFLVTLFQCTMVFYVAAVICRLLRGRTFGLVAALVLTCVLALLFPPGYGGATTEVLYPYFAIGIAIHRVPLVRMPYWASIVALLIFALLGPHWYRLHGPEFLSSGPLDGLWGAFFGPTVALSAIAAVMGLLPLVMRLIPQQARDALALVGRRSLDIYALHYFFLFSLPPVLGALASSLLVSWIIRLWPFAALVFFGERPKASSTPVG